MRVTFGLSLLILFSAITFSSAQIITDKTISLWLFDEQIGLYPSHVLDDNSENNIPLVLGLGGRIVEGKFGNALEPLEHPAIELPEGELHFGLVKLDPPEGRTVPPLTWYNANFAALMTGGENHLRKEVGFLHPTETKLNLGDFDWTVEFWFYPNRTTAEEGTVFEIGTGPRGENDKITRLSLDQNNNEFILYNYSTDGKIRIPTYLSLNRWSHIAVVYSSKGKELKHYVDGKLKSTVSNIEISQLENGEEDYMSIARNGMWGNPLQGKIDELRFSADAVYTDEFEPPDSFSRYFHIGYMAEKLIAGPPLLFDKPSKERTPIQLGNRKHVFIDDAFLQSIDEDILFNVNPPRKSELVISDIEGPYRKHLTVVEDGEGLIRIYNSAHDDYLIVYTSTDGVNFEEPNTGIEHRGRNNIVIPEPVGAKVIPLSIPTDTAIINGNTSPAITTGVCISTPLPMVGAGPGRKPH
jgi:hypothetical protein